MAVPLDDKKRTLGAQLKRFLSVLLCMVMVSGILPGSVFFAAAEESGAGNPISDAQPELTPEATPEILTNPYAEVFDGGAPPATVKNVGGGVIWRSESQSALSGKLSSVGELTLAYLECSKGVLILNEPVKWTVVAEGGSGGYSYSLYIYHTDGEPYSSLFYKVGGFGFTSANVFTYTPTKLGFYIVQVYIKDSQGNQLVWQTDALDAAAAADEGNINTVAGKVEYLKAQCLSNASTAYARAKWMHDWLVKNADYDYTYSNYTADGVLLKGSGVCDSYASAYYLLMRAVGIPCIEVANESHSWNMVKLGGFWYHVDVTWDDPLRYTYFLRSDAFIRTVASHRTWTERNGVAPECPYNWGEAGLLAAPFSITKIESMGGTSLKLTWNKVPGAAGCEVWRSTSKTGEYKLIKTTTATNFSNTYLKTGTRYFYKIRAYKLIDGEKVPTGNFSAVKAGVPLAKSAIVSAVGVSSSGVKLTWKKVPGATGYQVFKCATAGGVYKSIKLTTALTFTAGGLQSGKTYYFKVRPYKKISTLTYYGPLSGYKAGRTK